MEAWIAHRAEEDRRRKQGAQTMGAMAESLWNDLRSAIKSCVNDFNGLYREEPGREVDCAETGNEMVVSLKSRPEIHVRLKADVPNGVVTYRTSRNHQSMLAAEMSIFAGLAEPDEVLQIVLDEKGALHLSQGSERLGVAQASELILSPVFFPLG